jgi:putative membrane protein
MLVMFPQILLGATIVFTPRDLYRYYELCGTTIDPRSDQVIGGVIIWIPAAMMCVFGLLLVVDAMRRVEEAQRKRGPDDGIPAPTVPARLWTGR